MIHCKSCGLPIMPSGCGCGRLAKRPPSPGNVPITITRNAPITIRVGGVKITIEQEQEGHAKKIET